VDVRQQRHGRLEERYREKTSNEPRGFEVDQTVVVYRSAGTRGPVIVMMMKLKVMVIKEDELMDVMGMVMAGDE
jgi:hypothetical protein